MLWHVNRVVMELTQSKVNIYDKVAEVQNRESVRLEGIIYPRNSWKATFKFYSYFFCFQNHHYLFFDLEKMLSFKI